MKKEKLGGRGSAEGFDRLRRQAEEFLKLKQIPEDDSSADIFELIHELRVHQTELEIQNEELRRAQQELSELHLFFQDLYDFAPCAYLNLEPKGTIISTNQVAAMLVPDARGRVLHFGFSRFLAPNCEDAYFQALRETARTGEKQALELQLGGSRGAHRWVWAEIQADRTEAGEVRGYRLTLVDISAKKEAERALAESERTYRRLFDEMVCGALLLEMLEQDTPEGVGVIDGRIVEVNGAFVRLTGIAREEAVGGTLQRFWPDSREVWFDAMEWTARTGRPLEVDRFHHELGKHLLLSFFQLEGGLIGVTMLDISATKQSGANLGRTCRDLEIVVRERSVELLRADNKLGKEVEARTIAQQQLKEKNDELQPLLAELAETNAALQVLLKERDAERARLEEKVVCNINELVRPHLQKLAEGKLSERQSGLLEAVGRSLDSITSPLSRRFILEASRLTPVETQVAELIRQGKSTKEIADIMGVAGSTVDYHRLNIRRRLGLTNKGLNLQSYLKSLG